MTAFGHDSLPALLALAVAGLLIFAALLHRISQPAPRRTVTAFHIYEE
jgi:hypothetical protein